MEQTDGRDHKDYRLSAVMFADIVGFSRMMERDEAATLQLLRKLAGVMERLTTEFRGTIIKTIGDAYLVDFSNATNAVRCAVTLQREMVARNDESAVNDRVVLRIGIHLGDIYFFDDDALGEGINIASRLQSLAKPGRICISQDVYNLVVNKLDEKVVPMGRVSLKNITRRIDAYEIVVAGADAPTPFDAERPDRQETTADSRGPHDTATEDRVDLMELKDLVLKEIKRAGRRISVEQVQERLPVQSAAVNQFLGVLAEKGYLTSASPSAAARAADGGSLPLDRAPAVVGTRSVVAAAASGTEGRNTADEQLVTAYREQVFEGIEKHRAGFRGHLASYAAVNGGLAALWAATSGFGSFPWFLIVAMAWGIGVSTHWESKRQAEREVGQLRVLNAITRLQLKLLRKFNKLRNGLRSATVSMVATSGFLVGLNLITGAGVMWSLFPVGAMAVSLVIQHATTRPRIGKTLRELEHEGVPTVAVLSPPGVVSVGDFVNRRGPASPARVGGPTSAAAPAVEAERLRDAVAKQLKSFGKNQPLGGDAEIVLTNFVAQIRTLAECATEIDAVIASVPHEQLRHEHEQLVRRRENTTDQRMRGEYDRSIQQVERRQASFDGLRAEREMLDLRLNSALGSLRQMQIDLARMKTLSPAEESDSLATIKSMSRDLSLYLEDLREGYRQVE